MRVAIAICSAGRPGILAETLPFLARQRQAPVVVLLVVTCPADVPPRWQWPLELNIEVQIAPKGLPRQRNWALAALQDRCDVVLFMDDDYLPTREAVGGLARAFAAEADLSGLTGYLLADGIGQGGIALCRAAGLIHTYEGWGTPAPPRRRECFTLYGCNMAYRMAGVAKLRFDERLPLYAWQEDVDFAGRVQGRKIRSAALVGVHRGTPLGRETAGALLGYSQIANPVYLMAKGSMRPGHALGLMLRNVLANHGRSVRPEPWIDRRGRARGNWLALADLIRARMRPERILDLGKDHG